MGKFIDLTGQRFGKWLVLERAANSKSGSTRWLCRCDCGKEIVVRGGSLRNGHSKNCKNCFFRQKITHGQTGTRLYRVWRDMIGRCENLNHHAYKWYGGRGISVCPEWRKDFMVFKRWCLANGYKEGLTIDKIDNNKGYSPDNCQFITNRENVLKGWHVDGAHNGDLKRLLPKFEED